MHAGPCTLYFTHFISYLLTIVLGVETGLHHTDKKLRFKTRSECLSSKPTLHQTLVGDHNGDAQRRHLAGPCGLLSVCGEEGGFEHTLFLSPARP